MRVALVGKGPPERGGIATFLTGLVSGPLSTRFDVAMVNLTRPGAPDGGRLTTDNVLDTARDAGRVLRAAAGNDVVHIHSAMAPAVTAARAGVLALAARCRGARVVVHVHGGLLQLWMTTSRRRRLVAAALKPVNAVVAVSTGGWSALGEVVPATRLHLVANAVESEFFSAGPRCEQPVPRVLYVGLLTPRKGLLDLFEASRRLEAYGVPHEITVIGGTPDEGGSAERLVREAAPSTVRFVGTVDHRDLPAWYASADVFCLPSWWEAMPLSVLEAMACRLPVVATSVGDIPSIVDDNVTGLLVPRKSPEALADALLRLLSDPVLRRAMGEAGCARAARDYSMDRLVEGLTRVYQSLERRSA